MTDMLDIDRASMGWQVWLTPRQTRIILEALSDYAPVGSEDLSECWKLLEWFGTEAEIHKRKLGAQQTGEREHT